MATRIVCMDGDQPKPRNIFVNKFIRYNLHITLDMGKPIEQARMNGRYWGHSRALCIRRDYPPIQDLAM